MGNETVKVEYYVVNGDYGKVDYDLRELMENILPDMRPPISTIVILSTYNGNNVRISISPSGVTVRDA